MAEFADRVVELVAEPDYQPITLKAMSRQFEVPPDDYAEFRATVKRLDPGGEAATWPRTRRSACPTGRA